MKKFRKGAASFYMVSFSTLILVIIAASFATIIISEVTRASNDDLSQSAYDAALAGVEDAKIAYANYRRCVESGTTEERAPDGDGVVSCSEILYWMNHPDCDMVAHMIGRLGENESGEVLVSDTVKRDGGSDVTSDLNQAYTCVKIGTVLSDYRANLTSSSNYRLVRVGLDGVNASEVESLKLSWYSVKEGIRFNTTNFSNGKVSFVSVNDALQPPTPPTIELQMIQTANNFKLSELNGVTQGGETDRATLFLVPTNNANMAGGKSDYNYIGVYNNGQNRIYTYQVSKTNDQSISNLPFVVYCKDSADFACETMIELPDPIGGDRNDDTFLFLVTLPYGEPDTDFAIQFCTDKNCEVITDSATGKITSSKIAKISGVQVVIDSTGRANDLFRRVETRLESVDVSFPYAYYALQLLGGSNNDAGLEKKLVVTQEPNRSY